MTDNYPMTPSPLQLDQWEMVARATTARYLFNEPDIRAGHFDVVHRKALCLAFAAGADQELDACCEVMKANQAYVSDGVLRAIRRRPKPPTLKEQALEALKVIECDYVIGVSTDTIRRALNELPDN